MGNTCAMCMLLTFIFFKSQTIGHKCLVEDVLIMVLVQRLPVRVMSFWQRCDLKLDFKRPNVCVTLYDQKAYT